MFSTFTEIKNDLMVLEIIELNYLVPLYTYTEHYHS